MDSVLWSKFVDTFISTKTTPNQTFLDIIKMCVWIQPLGPGPEIAENESTLT